MALSKGEPLQTPSTNLRNKKQIEAHRSMYNSEGKEHIFNVLSKAVRWGLHKSPERQMLFQRSGAAIKKTDLLDPASLHYLINMNKKNSTLPDFTGQEKVPHPNLKWIQIDSCIAGLGFLILKII